MKKTLSLLILAGLFICFNTQKVFATSVGENIVFNVDSTYDSTGRENLKATLKVVGSYAYFYVDNVYWNSLNSSEKSLFSDALVKLSNEFDTVIYPKERSVFGSERSPGIDGDAKITILISQLINNAGGYLNTLDGYNKKQAPTSNEREMLYLNADVITNSKAKDFLAHEFQHLITFYQKTILYGLEEDVWLNEARSEYAVTLCGYNDEYKDSYLANRIDTFLDYPEDSLTEWKNNMPDYGVVNLFFHYLVNHYGKEIITHMVLNDQVGITSINQALKDLKHTETFSDIFADWAVASYLNDCKLGEEYCYLNDDLSYERLHVNQSAGYSGFPNLIIARSGAVKDWSSRWYRFRQGTIVPTDKDTLELEFKGLSETADFRVPYIVSDKDNQTAIRFMTLDNNQRGVVYIPEFTSLNKSVILIPFNQYKQSNFSSNEPLASFTFTASSVNTPRMIINNVIPDKGLAIGGLSIEIKGVGLSSVDKVIFGQSTISDFKVIDDQTISLIAPAQPAGKIDVGIVDNNGAKAVLANGFEFIGSSYPEGSLIRVKGDYKVYIIKDGYKRWIQHQDIFNMYGHLSWEDIIDIEPTELNQYQDAWLIRAVNDSRVYEVNADGTKHWLNMTAEEFSASGHQWNMVYVVNNFERDFYKTGSTILFQ